MVKKLLLASAPATATAQISPPTFAGGAVVEGDRGLNDRLMAGVEFFNGDPVVHTWTTSSTRPHDMIRTSKSLG
jgi:hypothetical protein